MCVKLSLATTWDVHPCATMRPRICDYNKFCFFGFFWFLMFFSQQHVRLKFRHKLLPIMNFYQIVIESKQCIYFKVF